MLLKVFLISALVDLTSAHFYELLSRQTDKGAGLARNARSRCVTEALECLDIIIRAELSFDQSVYQVKPFDTGPSYVNQLCRASKETIQCIENLGSCADMVMRQARPKIEWFCSPEGRAVYARLDGTSCTVDPSSDSAARICLQQLCSSQDSSIQCYRERMTTMCNSAYADYKIAMLQPIECGMG